MTSALSGLKIAFLTANSGVEQVELTEPWQAVIDAGGTPELLAPEPGDVQAYNHDVEPADIFSATVAVADAEVHDYAGLVLPGGTTNPDKLRLNTDAVAFVTGLAAAGTPIAAICHGPWTLVEAGLAKGRTLTSWPSLRTDISNAGGSWVDEQVQICTAGDFVLITSRKPDDLDAFKAAAIEQFAATRHS